MVLVKRISRLFAADVHAILDRLEEPEAVLRHAVREMDAQLARQRQRTRRLRAEIETVRTRLAAREQTRIELDSQLDLAFECGDDALARRLTRRKLETLRLVKDLEARRASLEDGLAEHDALVAANQDRLEGMQQKAEMLGAARVDGGDDGWRAAGRAIDDDDVELAFLREQQMRSRP